MESVESVSESPALDLHGLTFLFSDVAENAFRSCWRVQRQHVLCPAK